MTAKGKRYVLIQDHVANLQKLFNKTKNPDLISRGKK